MDQERNLRDEFAMLAMAGDWASALGRFDEDGDVEHLRERARLYYRMADAMIFERQIDRSNIMPFHRRKDDPPPGQS